ncbi:20192_t:CDS:2 [Rhizophagus irregularis]|nr:20192_t:CDS:2 [Rhizophagus irregularis]
MMISENKENVRKSHKLDDDGGGVDGGVRSIGIVFIYSYVYCHRIFKAKICATKDNEGIGISLVVYFKVELNHILVEFIVTIYISSYCLGSGNWIIYYGSKKVPSSLHGTNIYPSLFILSDLRDKD